MKEISSGLITRWSLVQVQVAPLFKNPFTTVLKWAPKHAVKLNKAFFDKLGLSTIKFCPKLPNMYYKYPLA